MRMGFRTWMRSITQQMAGFQWTASRMPRAAEGIITSYDTRSTFISGRVKQAYSPVVSQFEFRFRYVFGRFGFGARASISPTIHSQSRTVLSSPASIAGVTRNVLWMRQKL